MSKPSPSVDDFQATKFVKNDFACQTKFITFPSSQRIKFDNAKSLKFDDGRVIRIIQKSPKFGDDKTRKFSNYDDVTITK